jgi:hypothetical protein
MTTIEVKEVGRLRDGGTVIYKDALGNLYYLWYATQKVYNGIPFPKGDGVSFGSPVEPQAQELNVKLIIVEWKTKEQEDLEKSLSNLKDKVPMLLQEAQGIIATAKLTSPTAKAGGVLASQKMTY